MSRKAWAEKDRPPVVSDLYVRPGYVISDGLWQLFGKIDSSYNLSPVYLVEATVYPTEEQARAALEIVTLRKPKIAVAFRDIVRITITVVYTITPIPPNPDKGEV